MDSEEINPQDFPALENECQKSPTYRGAVVRAAMLLIKRRYRIRHDEIAQSFGIANRTFYRWLRGARLSQVEFEGAMALLAEFIP